MLFYIFVGLIFLTTLLILVLCHEFGHFLMARKFGIRVLEFGFGLPPRIWGKKFGQTLVSLNALPIGGFVRLLGEDETDKKILNDPNSFAVKEAWKRILVVGAGVVMNLSLAWILFYVVITFSNFTIIYPSLKPIIIVADVQEGLPAYQAGMKRGERILLIDNKSIKNIEEAITYIRSKPNQEILLTISDIEGKSRRQINLTPAKVESGQGLLGVVFSPVPFKQYKSFSEKLFSGITYSWDLTQLTFSGLGQLFSDLAAQNYQKASESVAGPIGIAVATKNIVGMGTEGLVPYIWFIGVISLTLAIFNILPIPALDGGRLLFLLYEFLFKKKVNPDIEKLIHSVGFALLVTLMVLITFSDIKKLF